MRSYNTKLAKTAVIALICMTMLFTGTKSALCGNALLKRLKAQPEHYLKDMVLSVSAHGKYNFCKSQFNQHGTCCDPEKLSEALPKLLDAWTDEVQAFVDKINSLKSFFFKNRWTIVNRTILMFEWA